MKTKTMLLAVSALAALAFAALPALAAADEVDWTNPHFTVTGEETKLTTNGETVECQEVTGTGEFEGESKTTGTVELTFHGCELLPLEFECHSAGHEDGTITTRELPFHIVQLTNDANEDTAGILMTPGGSSPKTFAEFSCVFELVPIHVIGNGVIGDITDPGYNDPSSTATMNFGVDGGNQQFTTVHGDETETEYELEAEISGETYPATQDGEGTIHFTEEANAKITTTPETE